MFYFILSFIVTWVLLLIVINIFSFDNNSWISKLHFLKKGNLFAPKPISSDYNFFYRDLLTNNETTSLKEIDFGVKHDFFSHRERVFLTRLYAKDNIKNESYNSFKIHLRELANKSVLKRQLCVIETFGFKTDKEKKIVLIDYV